MWIKSENGESIKPSAIERCGDYIIVRRRFNFIEETDEFPAHWEYEEWQMTNDQYEIYAIMQAQLVEQEDAILELADLIGGGLS